MSFTSDLSAHLHTKTKRINTVHKNYIKTIPLPKNPRKKYREDIREFSRTFSGISMNYHEYSKCLSMIPWIIGRGYPCGHQWQGYPCKHLQVDMDIHRKYGSINKNIHADSSTKVRRSLNFIFLQAGRATIPDWSISQIYRSIFYLEWNISDRFFRMLSHGPPKSSCQTGLSWCKRFISASRRAISPTEESHLYTTRLW